MFFRPTNDERVVATWYKCIDNELETYETEGQVFMCKIIDKFDKLVTRPMRNVMSDDAKLILYATNCFLEINPEDKIVIEGIGKFKVDQFQIDYADPRFRNFGAHPGAMKLRCPKIISLV